MVSRHFIGKKSRLQFMINLDIYSIHAFNMHMSVEVRYGAKLTIAHGVSLVTNWYIAL